MLRLGYMLYMYSVNISSPLMVLQNLMEHLTLINAEHANDTFVGRYRCVKTGRKKN